MYHKGKGNVLGPPQGRVTSVKKVPKPEVMHQYTRTTNVTKSLQRRTLVVRWTTNVLFRSLQWRVEVVRVYTPKIL